MTGNPLLDGVFSGALGVAFAGLLFEIGWRWFQGSGKAATDD